MQRTAGDGRAAGIGIRAAENHGSKPRAADYEIAVVGQVGRYVQGSASTAEAIRGSRRCERSTVGLRSNGSQRGKSQVSTGSTEIQRVRTARCKGDCECICA